MTKALVMCGGRGERLRPLTDETAKPMLPVGRLPLLAHTIRQLNEADICDITLALNYRKDDFIDWIEHWRAIYPAPKYLIEAQPLGTGGALNLLEWSADEPLLVMNGDLWTDLDFRALAAFHAHHGAALTAASFDYESHNRYGLLLTDGLNVTGLREKAGIHTPVLAGIYMLSPICWDFLPRGRFDMPDLIVQLLGYGLEVKHFPLRGYTWKDIGTLEDYERVCALARTEVAV